jgi:hypothetical protein
VTCSATGCRKRTAVGGAPPFAQDALALGANILDGRATPVAGIQRRQAVLAEAADQLGDRVTGLAAGHLDGGGAGGSGDGQQRFGPRDAVGALGRWAGHAAEVVTFRRRQRAEGIVGWTPHR